MQNITTFLDKWANRIMLPLVFIIFFKTCSTNGRIDTLSKTVTEQNSSLDSTLKTKSTLSKEEVQRMIKIEGLKAEKRMIQSTDRKIMDVNRQSEIDKEIQELEGK